MRIALVNDLRIARETLRRLVVADPANRVAWTAEDGEEAVRRCAEDRPDLVLMDLVMPGMDGVEATRRIMRASPCPILIVTATVEGYASKVFHALGAGALDAVKCPTVGPDGALVGAEALLRKVRALGILQQAGPATAATAVAAGATSLAAAGPVAGGPGPLVAIGASTGGPQALAEVLGALAPDFPAPIVVAQHINAEFADGLVAWLSRETRRAVRAVRAGDLPREGTVHVAATDDHLVMGAGGSLRYDEEPAGTPYRPSVDVLFSSLRRAGARPGVAVVLTGMGRDGARGMLELRQAGWSTVAQDEATSVVWGMPRACGENGAAQAVLPLDRIAARIEEEWRRLAAPAAAGGAR